MYDPKAQVHLVSKGQGPVRALLGHGLELDLEEVAVALDRRQLAGQGHGADEAYTELGTL